MLRKIGFAAAVDSAWPVAQAADAGSGVPTGAQSDPSNAVAPHQVWRRTVVDVIKSDPARANVDGPSGSLGRPGTRFRRVAKRELILRAATLRVAAKWSSES
jgi:hypothetical protein